MTLADAHNDYARHCQREWLHRFLRFGVFNSTNDNPCAPTPLLTRRGGGIASPHDSDAPNDTRGDFAERFTSSPFSHEANNAR